ncbi:MAG: cytochrome P450 [Gammaproteobacteria bacterium]|nr:cytochrome P450 [Gammaproteobacteria bacterium]
MSSLEPAASAAAGARPRTIESLPGPRGLPVLGNALQIDASRIHHVLEGWTRQYGSFFRFSMGARKVLAIADPQAINAVLKDRPDTFHRTRRVVSIGREVGLTGVFFANGDAWRQQRRMVMSAFDPAHIKRYFPSLVTVTERLLRRWRAAAESGREIELQSDLMRFTVDVTAGLAFGTDINTLESQGDVIQQHLDRVLPTISRRLIAPFTYWRVLKLPADRRLDRHLREIHRAIQGFIAAARERMRADPALCEKPSNMIEAMIAARDAGDSGVDDDDVAGNVFTMLIAGEDTTANTLAWMIYLLSRTPAAMERAVIEVDGAIGEGGIVRRFEQAGSLPYLDACASEAMRLKPVAPVIFSQVARDTTVAGIAVPAGTIVCLILRAGAVDERHFPDPQSFNPARWLAADSAAKRVSMPFGAGPRLCPGRYLALLEIKMVMAMLLRNFDVQSVSSASGRPAIERMALTMAPEPLRMRLALRPSN